MIRQAARRSGETAKSLPLGGHGRVLAGVGAPARTMRPEAMDVEARIPRLPGLFGQAVEVRDGRDESTDAANAGATYFEAQVDPRVRQGEAIPVAGGAVADA